MHTGLGAKYLIVKSKYIVTLNNSDHNRVQNNKGLKCRAMGINFFFICNSSCPTTIPISVCAKWNGGCDNKQQS